MKSRTRTVLSLFLSATLAFGGIPAPALAQMGEEASTISIAPDQQGERTSNAQAIFEWLDAKLVETVDNSAYVRGAYDALATLYAGIAGDDAPQVNPDDSQEAAEAVALACAARSIEGIVVCDAPAEGDALAEGDSTGAYVWNMVCLDGSWYHVDVLSHAKEIAGHVQESDQHRYLLVSDETIRANDGRGTWAAKDGGQTPVAQKDYAFAQPVAEQPAEKPVAEQPAEEKPAEQQSSEQLPAENPAGQPAADQLAETPATDQQSDPVTTPDEQPAQDTTTENVAEPAEAPADGSQTPAVVPNETKETPSKEATPTQKSKDDKTVGAYELTNQKPRLTTESLTPESLAPDAASDFTTTPSGSGVEITGYNGSGGHVVIPATINGSTVVSIGGQAFANMNSITEVTIPATVTSIGWQAFADCYYLSTLHLPTSGLSEIGDDAFYETGLTSVSIPGCVKTIGVGAFCSCYYLSSIQLGDGLKEIGEYAFQYCTATSIHIPKSVEQIGEDAPALVFYRAAHLSSITVDSDNEHYAVRDGILYSKDGSVLYMHPSARQAGTIYVPSTVTSVAECAFFNNSGITEVVIPSSVTSVGRWAFAYSSVTRGTIPETVTEVEDGLFDGCSSLTEVSYLSPAAMPYRFCEGCSNLTSLTLGNRVTTIGDRAFKDCNLSYVYIPDSVTEVGFNAFTNNKNLVTVVGAQSLVSIGSYAFSYTGISSFPWGSKLRYVNGDAFLGCSNFSNPDFPSYLTRGDDGSYWVYDDNYTLVGTCDYNMANEVLRLVNQERSAEGLSPLAMDSDLQEAAMRRAAECSLDFSHGRPNGSDSSSLCPAKASGENIAAGDSTAEDVMDTWMSSWGHCANILGSSYQSIGVGCFQVGAVYYWVQVFGRGAAEGSAGSGRRERKFDTDVLYSIVPLERSGFNLNEWHDDPIVVICGSTKKLTVGIANPGWERVFCPVDGSSFTWTSSNPSVARVDSNGMVTAGQQTGLSTITATSRGGHSWSIGIECRSYLVSYLSLWADGVYWSPVFDVDYYAAQNPDVRAWAQSGTVVDGDKLLQHFVSNGAKEGRRSKADFDLASYYNANPDLRRAFGNDWARYYRHYATSGYNENRVCSGVGSLRGYVTSRDGVEWSPVYDGAYYAQQNGDVKNWATRRFNSGSVVDDAALLQHFVSSGAKEGRRSKAGFEVASYFNANADLRTAFGGTADLSKYYRHYATKGASEGRRCSNVGSLQGSVVKRDGVDWSPVYDRAYYAQQNSDVASWATRKCGSATVLDDFALLQHFVNNGSKEGRKSKDGFELASYYNANADLRRAFGTSDWTKYYRHYATNGQRERRTCSGVGSLRGFATSLGGVDWAPTYDANEYASRNADLASWARRSFSSGSVLDDAALLSHFVNNGQKERRQAKSTFNVTNYRNRYADLNRAFGDNWPSYYRHFATNGFKENRNGA